MNLKKIQQGCEKAFMEMVDESTPALRAYLAPKLYGREELEDLLQEIFIAAYKGRATLSKSDSIIPWLKGIARNKLKLFYRTKFRRQKMTLNFQEFILASIEENMDDHSGNDDKSILIKCMEKLPAKLKKLVALRHLSGVRVKDLAHQESCSESQISVSLFRARQKLKECVEKHR